MAWMRKKKPEEKTKTIKKKPSIDLDALDKAVNGNPKKPEPIPPVVVEEVVEDPQPELVEELKDGEWYVVTFKVPLSGKMINRMRKVGELRGFADEADLVREGLRRVLW